MNRTGLILAIAVVLISNIFILIGVAANRSGTPFETTQLTERELTLQSQPQDNSAISLYLNWRQPTIGQAPPGRVRDVHFDGTQLKELGFDCTFPRGSASAEKQLLPREVFVALEYDGEAWIRWLKLQEESASSKPQPPSTALYSGSPADVERQRRGASRLFIVDAARNAAGLRSRYPDQNKHLIVRAIVAAQLDVERDPITKAVKSSKWRGYVSEIIPSEIHVPLPFAKLLSGLGPRAEAEPRYSITLRYGRKLEPWITDVKLIEKK
jgi:hypothetical protein